MGLREARERQGVSQYRLAQLTGIPQTTLSAIERGKYRMPEWVAMDVADVLGVHPHDLCSPEERQPRGSVEWMGKCVPLEEADGHVTYPSPEKTVCRRELCEAVRTQLDTLLPRERTVLLMRFGLGSHKEHSIAEVGKHRGVTGGRIRQIEAMAFRKLQHPLRKRKLREYL